MTPILQSGRGLRALRTRLAVLSASWLWIALLACGEGAGSGGGGPTEPPADGDVASIVATGGVEIGLCDGIGLECSYSQSYRNLGSGCANTVRGKVRAYREDTLLETVEWWLATPIVIQPGEVFLVEDCCISSATAQTATRYTGEAFWNNVACS